MDLRLTARLLLRRVLPGSKKRSDALWYGLPLLAAALVYCIYLKGDLYGDELGAYQWATKGTPLLETGAPPTVFNIDIMLSRLAISVVKQPWALRVPSFIFGLLTIVMVGRLGYFLNGRRTALISMWVAACSPMLIEFATEGRPYTIYSFLSTALLYYTLRFIRHEDVPGLLAVAASAILGCLSRTVFIANLAFVGGLYLWKRKSRALNRYSVTVMLLVAPFIARLFLISQHYSAYAPKTGAGEEAVSLGNFFARGVCALNFGFNLFTLPSLGLARNVPLSKVIVQNAPVAVLAAVALLGLACACLRLLRTERPLLVLLLCACVIPAAVLVAIGSTGYSIVREKYLIGVLGPYAVLLGVLGNQLITRWPGRCIALAFLVVTGVSLEHYFVHPEVYSRRMLFTALNVQLNEAVSKDDMTVAYHVIRWDPWYLTFLDRADRKHVDLYDDVIQKGSNIVQYTESIDKQCPGRIFLIGDEGPRLWLDRSGQVLQVFCKDRAFHTKKFGRNLVLYIFEPLGTASGSGQP